MFLEPRLETNPRDGRAGWIEVICGSMFSGKTEELIRRLTRALIAKQKVEIFKPKLDTRYHEEKIVSHAAREIRSTPVDFANDILLLAGDCDVVGIDEAQFFDPAIVDVCNDLANAGKRVIVAGLDMDFEGRPFGPMPHLLAVASDPRRQLVGGRKRRGQRRLRRVVLRHRAGPSPMCSAGLELVLPPKIVNDRTEPGWHSRIRHRIQAQPDDFVNRPHGRGRASRSKL